MTNTDTAHDDVRDARIDAIADELVSLAGNDPATVREAAALAKSFKIGEPVQHVRQPHLSGIVGNSVTETLCIGLTTEAAGLSAAYCFVNPANLARIDAALATTTQPDTDSGSADDLLADANSWYSQVQIDESNEQTRCTCRSGQGLCDFCQMVDDFEGRAPLDGAISIPEALYGRILTALRNQTDRKAVLEEAAKVAEQITSSDPPYGPHDDGSNSYGLAIDWASNAIAQAIRNLASGESV